MNIITNRFDNGDLSFKIRDFAHYVTNVYAALPELDVMHCYQMMKANEVLQRRMLADSMVHELHDAIKALSAWPEMESKGCIWFSFHIGPYHLLAQLLAKLNLPLYVLVSKQVYDDYHHQLLATKVTEHVCLINVEDSQSIWRIKHAIRNGIQILVYLDGNMGAGPKLKHGIHLPLGDRWWHLSTVLAKLARQHHVLVVPIWLFVDNEQKILLKLGVPQVVVDETEFLQNCFLQFYRDMLRYPEQWKGWLFAHHDLSGSTSIPIDSSKSWCFPDFLPYPVNNKYFLLERSTGLFYETNDDRYQHICKGMEIKLSS
ncbi:hypothetical protein [Sphingobacterium faecium]|uniref:hypothetical protein n=1 Tax=Sphingobacterium faecium TaxID=34087 RepID=UPI002468AA14|nr:hypothetical protein [Sphingobacterium faecium]MDH5828727.1 hypothetical protein [Sphingobacterium faecium]